MERAYENSMYKIYLYALNIIGQVPVNERFPYTDIGEISTMMKYVDITRNVLSSALDRSLIEGGFDKRLVRQNEVRVELDKAWYTKQAHPVSGHEIVLCVEGMSDIHIKYSIKSGDFTAHKVCDSNEVVYVLSDKENHHPEVGGE